MVDWRLIALVGVFAAVAWVTRKREEWVQPLGVAAAVTVLVAGLLFLGIPLIK